MAEGFRLHPDSGKFLVTNNGFAVHEDCCCGAPCTDCASATPSAVVTISGSCSGQESCESLAGLYPFSTFYSEACGSEDFCRWDIRKNPPFHPTMALVKERNGDFYCYLYAIWSYGGPDLQCPPTSGLVWGRITGISCQGGELSGSFDLPGLGDCAGCTAHITIS